MQQIYRHCEGVLTADILLAPTGDLRYMYTLSEPTAAFYTPGLNK